MITHSEQQKIWDEEHKHPHVLKQMDVMDVSSGVIKFWDFLQSTGVSFSQGLEMACGKGRNVIWLSKQGVGEMHGFDFSGAAIEEAKKRALEAGDKNSVFEVMDATLPWKYDSNYFDFGIDCFASTDIETKKDREFAIQEMHRVIRPGGYLLAYLLSTDDEFHKEMIGKFPAEERNAFFHPTTGKFEKTFDEEEIKDLYKDFTIIKKERIEKTTEFFGKNYKCKHFWVIFQKAL